MRQKIAILGLGKVGSVLAEALSPAYDIVKLKRGDWSGLADCAALIITVQDRHIAAVAAEAVRHAKPGILAFHCSGALDHSLLQPLTGASIHPLQTFPDTASGLKALPGTSWFCEGNEKALRFARDMIGHLKGHMVPIEASQKTAYHAAVCMAANYLTTLVAASEQIAAGAGIDPVSFRKALAPIMRATLENTLVLGPAAALTGPVRRGEKNVVAAHLAAIGKHNDSKQLKDLYQLLAEVTQSLIVP